MPPAHLEEKTGEGETQVYIGVAWFAGWLRCFGFRRLISPPQVFQLNRPYSLGSDDERDRYSDGVDFEGTERMLDFFGIEGDPREQWRRNNLIEFQNGLLGHSISRFDRPGGAPKRLARVADLWKRQAHALLFSIDLRGLPARDESKDFKAHVREQVRAVGERWGERGRFIVPVELDIQVPEQKGRPTDLDNIVRSYIA